MTSDDFGALHTLGLTTAVAQRAAALWDDGHAGTRLARVVEVHRDGVRVHDGETEASAGVPARLARLLGDDGDALAVGDWLLVREAAGARQIEARLAPSTQLARRTAEGRRAVLVSNVDVALLVMGLDGDYNPRRAERYLALVEAAGVLPAVVLTKADLVEDAQRDARVDTLRARLPARVDVVAVDATRAEAAQALAPYATPGQTLVLLGSSGAGKSTLTNALLGAAVQSTGAVRTHDSRGRHTTTARTLFRLPGGACVIDTPGLRALRPDLGEGGLAASFDDIAALASRCRFRDCAHDGEPGCAVRAAVDADRLDNWHKLRRDAQRDTMTALDRQRQRSAWKARTRSAGAWMKAKRGG